MFFNLIALQISTLLPTLLEGILFRSHRDTLLAVQKHLPQLTWGHPLRQNLLHFGEEVKSRGEGAHQVSWVGAEVDQSHNRGWQRLNFYTCQTQNLSLNTSIKEKCDYVRVTWLTTISWGPFTSSLALLQKKNFPSFISYGYIKLWLYCSYMRLRQLNVMHTLWCGWNWLKSNHASKRPISSVGIFAFNHS